VLRIGSTCLGLDALFSHHDVDCAGFLTAYNPRGTQQSDLKGPALPAPCPAERSGSDPNRGFGFRAWHRLAGRAKLLCARPHPRHRKRLRARVRSGRDRVG
jgi:hypothetical protein